MKSQKMRSMQMSASGLRNEELREMCNMDVGLLSPRVFSDERIYQLELERIFGRAWVLLCPETQIPQPGDYFNTYVGADRVIVVRQKDGSIKALLNQCRHRGNELVRSDSGNTKSITCSYHGWSFDIAGDLRNVPYEEVVFPNGFDKSAWSLGKMAQVDCYKGLVFGTWDASAPPLLDYLDDAAWYLDTLFDRFEGGLELMGGVSKWVIKANWKIVAEQFANDMLHPEITHISAFMASIPPGADMTKMQLPVTGRQFTSPNGHGMGLWTDGPILGLTVGERVGRYIMEESHPEAVARIGKARADIQAAHLNLFPASIVLFGFNHLRVIHPVSATESEIWTWVFAPKAAPPDVKKLWVTNSQRAFGAGGLFETEDSAVWSGIQRTMRGAMGRKLPFNVQMGDRINKGPDPDYPGRVTQRAYSEVAARGFYQRWLEMLTTETWPQLQQVGEVRHAVGGRQ
jgi:phenylpropionate dioxygenase-like ring-hydroxylating dioxygenase large terminal subunit